MATTGRISDYDTQIAELLPDTTLVDVSVLISVGPDVWDTQSVPYSILKTSGDLLAFRLNSDFGSLAVLDLTWNCSAKLPDPTLLRLRHVSGSPQAIGDIKIRVQIDSGQGNVVPEIQLEGVEVGSTFKYQIGGALPAILSDSNTLKIEITQEHPFSNAFFDVYIDGAHEDV